MIDGGTLYICTPYLIFSAMFNYQSEPSLAFKKCFSYIVVCIYAFTYYFLPADPYSFSIGDTTKFTDYTRGGLCTQVKQPKAVHFVSSLIHSLIQTAIIFM